MVLAVLGVVWAVVIGSYLKEKTESSTGDSVSAFRDQLSTLQRTYPGGQFASSPRHRSDVAAGYRISAVEARRRRRDVLFTLMGLAAFTFVVALVKQTAPFVVLNVVFDLAAAGYVALLVNQQRIVQEQATKVRHLHPVAPRGAMRPAHADYRVQRMAAGGNALR